MKIELSIYSNVFSPLCIKDIKCTQLFLFIADKFNVYRDKMTLFVSIMLSTLRSSFSGITIGIPCVSPGVQPTSIDYTIVTVQQWSSNQLFKDSGILSSIKTNVGRFYLSQ